MIKLTRLQNAYSLNKRYVARRRAMRLLEQRTVKGDKPTHYERELLKAQLDALRDVWR